jgi:hypothetical protein
MLTVDKKYILDRCTEDVATECWVWNLSRNVQTGYAQSSPCLRQFGSISVHRAAFVLWVGSIPAGLQIDHLCRNHACVNPAHLRAVTQKVNILAGTGSPAINAKKTHCKQGHEFTAENTMVRKGRYGPQRSCRICVRSYDAQWRKISKVEKRPPRGRAAEV